MNGRGGRSRVDKGRDPGRFIGLPVSVLESAAYLGLSANARSLLLEVAMQFHGDDNGRMLLSREYLSKRGWNSNSMITKGKRELLEAELIFETVKGHRPNKASWYAVTWRRLDKLPGFDHGVERAFEQGAYKRGAPLADVTKFKGYDKSKDVPLPPINGAAAAPPHGTGRPAQAGTVLRPQCGTGSAAIAPPHGTGTPAPAPPQGAIGAVSGAPPVPQEGHPLEKPSARVALRRLSGLGHATGTSAANGGQPAPAR